MTKKRGQAFIIVASAIVALIAMLGLAVDLGNLYEVRRDMQTAADAAAIAAYNQSSTQAGVDVAGFNGFSTVTKNGKVITSVSVTQLATPPTGYPAGNYYQASITNAVPMTFLSIVGFSTVSVAVSALGCPVNGQTTTTACNPNGSGVKVDSGATVQWGERSGDQNHCCGVISNASLTISGSASGPSFGSVGGCSGNKPTHYHTTPPVPCPLPSVTPPSGNGCTWTTPSCSGTYQVTSTQTVCPSVYSGNSGYGFLGRGFIHVQWGGGGGGGYGGGGGGGGCSGSGSSSGCGISLQSQSSHSSLERWFVPANWGGGGGGDGGGYQPMTVTFGGSSCGAGTWGNHISVGGNGQSTVQGATVTFNPGVYQCYSSGSSATSSIEIGGDSQSYNNTVTFNAGNYTFLGNVSICGNNTVTLSPGSYYGGITIQSNSTGSPNVTFAPGTYYMGGGGLSVTGQCSLSGTGVTFYNTSDTSCVGVASGPISIGPNSSDSVSCSFSAPTSGAFQGILFLQDPSIGYSGSSRSSGGGIYGSLGLGFLLANWGGGNGGGWGGWGGGNGGWSGSGSSSTPASQCSIQGAAGSTFDGGIYTPNAYLSYCGSSSGSGYTNIVADSVEFTRNSTVGCNYGSTGGTSPTQTGGLCK